MTTTQNCAECGTRAEPGQSFCDACGAVLSWKDREPRNNRPPTPPVSTLGPDGTAARRAGSDDGSPDPNNSTPARTGAGAADDGFGGTVGGFGGAAGASNGSDGAVSGSGGGFGRTAGANGASDGGFGGAAGANGASGGAAHNASSLNGGADGGFGGAVGADSGSGGAAHNAPGLNRGADGTVDAPGDGSDAATSASSLSGGASHNTRGLNGGADGTVGTPGDGFRAAANASSLSGGASHNSPGAAGARSGSGGAAHHTPGTDAGIGGAGEAFGRAGSGGAGQAGGSGMGAEASGEPSGGGGVGGTPASTAPSATSSAGSGPTAPSATSATADPASSAASGLGPGPGWDAFSRPDGGAGLARTPRDLLVSGTATESPSADHPTTDADRAAPGAADQPATPRTAPPTPATVHNSPSPSGPSHANPTMDDTAPTEPVPAAAATTPLPDVASAPAPTPPQASDPSGLTDRARQLLVPVADPEPRPAAAPSVAPVLPGRPVPQRPQVVRAPGEELGADGGTPCPWCGTRNRPDRHFCTRCAMPMAGEARSPGRLPWWRRLFGAGNRETPWAGDRPRLRRAFDRVLTWLGVAVVLTLLIVGAVHLPQGIQATRDHFSKRAPVDPDSYSASRSYPGHKPDLAFDKFNNTWWGPGVSDSGQGQWIEAKFNEPTRLLDLRITPGVSTRADQLQQSARPHRIEATVTLANGKKTTRQLVLDQGPGSQREPFRVGEVTAVRFTIESAYGADASKQVAIAEIEFYGPSNAN